MGIARIYAYLAMNIVPAMLTEHVAYGPISTSSFNYDYSEQREGKMKMKIPNNHLILHVDVT